MCEQPKILTKFMNFRPEIFMQPRLKLSLPSEFNDPFDSQLRLSDDDFTKLAIATDQEIGRLKYFVNKMQAVHILSLSARNAIELQSSNMWGLYANSGKGIAFEFDFIKLKNVVNGEPSTSFLYYFNKLKSDPNKISFLKGNINDEIFSQIKQDHSFIKNALYPRVENSDINLIPSDCISNPKLAKFEIDLSSKTLDDIKINDDWYLLSNLLELCYKSVQKESRSRLFKVNYVHDYSKLKSILRSICLQQYDNLLKPINEFMTHKTNNWESEAEYRILVSEYIITACLRLDDNILNNNLDYSTAIRNLNEQINSKMEFINFSDKLDYTKIKENSFYRITTLPFPQKIYLGWDFDIDSKYGKENLALIIRYCNQHSIKYLHKLEKIVDYDSSQFKYGLNLLNNSEEIK